MALKAILDSIDELPDDLKQHYKATERDGETVYVLGIDGFDEHPSVRNLKTAHERVKDELKTAKSERADLASKVEAFGELTPDELDELRRAAETPGKKQLTQQEIDDLLKEKFQIQQLRWEKEREALVSERDELAQKFDSASTTLKQERIANTVRDAALKQGVRAKALPLVNRMAMDIWTLDEDGNPVAMKGDEVMSGPTGPLTVDEWVEGLSATDDYLFEPNRGGGADNGDRARGGRGMRTISEISSAEDIEAIASGEAVRAR